MRVDRFLRRVLLFAVSCVVAPAFSQTAAEAGTVERLTGSVAVVSAGVSRVARPGERLLVGEVLSTAAGAEALVRLRDESTLALRPNTQVTVSEFRYQEKEDDSFAANLLRGVVRSVSGLIGKSRPRGVIFRTPTATVGIRGTDFELAIVEAGDRDRAGVYNYVHDGQTNIQIAAGDNLDVSAEQTGFAPQDPQPGEAALQLLRERPAFLRGGGFDAMMIQTRPPPSQIFMPRMR
jgi:hypothetical protein